MPNVSGTLPSVRWKNVSILLSLVYSRSVWSDSDRQGPKLFGEHVVDSWVIHISVILQPQRNLGHLAKQCKICGHHVLNGQKPRPGGQESRLTGTLEE